MRRIMFLGLAVWALSACNGGEDFSDATIAGCPIGANCQENASGDVLVSLIGPQVENLGYQCGGSLFKTQPEEETVGGTTVPAYQAVCPNTAQSIEFFIGSGIFEGNRVPLGEFYFPRQLMRDAYQITLADLVESPARRAADDPLVIYPAALVLALDSDPSTDLVEIPDKAHEVIDEDFANVVPEARFSQDDFATFETDWQDYFDELPNVPGLNSLSETSAKEAVQAGNNRSRSGFYVLENGPECAIVSFGCQDRTNEESEYQNIFFSLRVLMLPDGSLLGGGPAARSQQNSSEQTSITNTDFVALKAGSQVNDELFLTDNPADEDARDVGIDGLLNTNNLTSDTRLSGRFLGQTLYNNVDFGNGSDYSLDYANPPHRLKAGEQGRANGDLFIGDTLGNPGGSAEKGFPFRASKTGGKVQAKLDSEILSDLTATNYTVTLKRACLDGESDPSNQCDSIPDPTPSTDENEEIGEGGNYPSCIRALNQPPTNPDDEGPLADTDPCSDGTEVSEERDRVVESSDGSTYDSFCIAISNAPGEEGIITTGARGACPTVADEFPIGFVTRTFADDNRASVVMLLSPGAENVPKIPQFGSEIQGLIDLNQNCHPLLSAQEDKFDLGLRARWLDSYYPSKLDRKFRENDAEPSNDQLEKVQAYQLGAVEFHKDTLSCQP